MKVISKKITALCDEIVKGFSPQKVILFGSYANGSPNADSDVDLMVVMRFRGRSVDQAIKIRRNVSTRLPLDLLVRTPEQIAKRTAMGDFFITDIMDRGRVLYDEGS